MKFSLFKPPMDRYLLKSREYLEEAKIKRVDHQAAAEHHGALTQLYAERIAASRWKSPRRCRKTHRATRR